MALERFERGLQNQLQNARWMSADKLNRGQIAKQNALRDIQQQQAKLGLRQGLRGEAFQNALATNPAQAQQDYPMLHAKAFPQEKLAGDAKNLSIILGRNPTYQELNDFRKSGAQSINIGQPGSQYGKIGEGFERIVSPDGSVKDVPIKGSKPDIARLAAEEKKRRGDEVILSAAQTVFEDAERSLEIVKEYGRGATGITAMATDWLPEAPSGRLSKHIESIKGNIGIDQLLKIKKSGAGLGQVPQSQLEMLAGLLGKLDTNMNKKDLTYNIKRIQEIYSRIIKGIGGDPKTMHKERKQRLQGNAPPDAVTFLQSNPTYGMKEAFKAKYGYLPEGI